MAAPSAPSQLRRRRSLATAVVVDATRGDPVARPDPGRSGRAKRALHPLAGLGNHPGRRWACRGGAAAAGGAQRLRHGRLSGPMPAARAWSAPLPLQAPRGRPGRAACARRPRAGAGAGPHLQGPCGRGAGRHLRTLTRPTLGPVAGSRVIAPFGPGRSRPSLHVPSVEHPWTRLGRGPRSRRPVDWAPCRARGSDPPHLRTGPVVMADPDVVDAMRRSFLGRLPPEVMAALLADGEHTDYRRAGRSTGRGRPRGRRWSSRVCCVPT